MRVLVSIFLSSAVMLLKAKFVNYVCKQSFVEPQKTENKLSLRLSPHGSIERLAENVGEFLKAISNITVIHSPLCGNTRAAVGGLCM